MPISRFKSSLVCLLLAACPAAAQDFPVADEAGYRKMVEQAMKSGNYSQPESQSWDARLKVISGTVMVKTAEKDEWSKIEGEIPLDPNDVVKTSADGLAEICLDDKGVISLNRNTEVEIASLEQEDAVFSLSFGSLVAKVKHFLNEKHKLKVRTPSAVCAIRGTEFAVEYSVMSKEAAVGVFDEGRVAVTQAADAAGGQEYLLEKNTEIVLNPTQKRIRTVPLSRMSRHRGVLTGARKRLLALKGWRPRSAAKRAELRDRALKRKVIRKQLGGAKAGPKAGAKARAAAKKKAGARTKAKRQARPAYDEE